MRKAIEMDVTLFIRQMEAMYDRLGALYNHASLADTPKPELLPSALKELGLAAEELQVATEELHQQSEQMATNFQAAAAEVQYQQALFDHAASAQLVSDLEGRILAMNQAAARLLKVEQHSLSNRLLVNFVPLNWRSAFRSQLHHLQQANRAQMWRIYMLSQEDEPLDVVVSTALVYPHDQEQARIHWTLQDASQLQMILSNPLLEENRSQPGNSHPHQTILSYLENYPWSRYDKGDSIPLKPQSLWFVKQGLVKLSTLTANNEEVVLGLVGVGMPLTSGSPALLTYQATTMTEVSVVSVPLSELQVDPDLAQLVLSKFNHRLRQTEVLLNVAGQRRISDRLYHLLQFLKQEIGQPVEGGTQLAVRLTHEDLANLCCTTRVTMTRLLGELQQQQKIRFDRHYLILQKSAW